MAQVRLCYIQCFRASELLLTQMIIPKERSGGQYKIKCMISAFNDQTQEAWIYMEIEQIRITLLEKAMVYQGFTSVLVDSFSCKDYATAASKGYKTVKKKSSQPGFRLITRGSPSSYVLQTADAVQNTEDNGIPLDVIKDMQVAIETADERIQSLEDELSLKECCSLWSRQSYTVILVSTGE